MATRDVQLRLSTTGLDKAVAQFDALSKKLDGILSKVSDLSGKLDRLGAKKVAPEVDVKGIDAALAKVGVLKAALDSLGDTTARVGSDVNSGTVRRALSRAFPLSSGFVSLGGGRSDGMVFRESDRASLEGRVARDEALARAAGGGIDRGMFNLLGSFGRWGGIPGGIGRGILGAGSAAAGGVSSAGAAISKVPWAAIGIGSGVGLAASLTPAIIPLLLGLGVGGLGTFGAMKIASSANTQLTALQTTLSSAQQTLAQDIATGASPAQTAFDRLQAVQAQQAVTQFQQAHGPALGLYSTMTRVGSAASSAFMGALSGNATRTVQDRVGHGLGTDTHQVSVGGTSFLAGIGKITGQIPGFITSIGPQLGDMFRASLPFIASFVKMLEDMAKIVFPAVTAALKQFRPFLPLIRDGFRELSQGIADFLHYLGPGMKAGAIVFKASMDVVKALLIALSVSVAAMANLLQILGHVIRDVGHWMVDAWRAVESFFSQVGTGAQRVINNVVLWFQRLPSSLKRIGMDMIRGLISGMESIPVIGPVIGIGSHIIGALGKLFHLGSPSRLMFAMGANIGEGLALGIDSKTGRVLSSATNMARGIPGAVGGSAGSRAAIPLEIRLSLSDELMQVISRKIRVMGGDPRILIRKVQLI